MPRKCRLMQRPWSNRYREKTTEIRGFSLPKISAETGLKWGSWRAHGSRIRTSRFTERRLGQRKAARSSGVGKDFTCTGYRLHGAAPDGDAFLIRAWCAEAAGPLGQPEELLGSQLDRRQVSIDPLCMSF